MIQPNIETAYPVPANGIKFIVVAFRQLTTEEMQQSIAHYFRTVKRKAKIGSLVKIFSIIE